MISPAKQKALGQKMAALGLREGDIEEQFVRASGPGGQKVNKASSAVLLTHRPSGIQVKCQVSRSQVENRFLARRILVERLEARLKGERSAEQKRVEKIRRQKRRRSRRAKEKILRAKHRRSEILSGRRVEEI